MIWLLRHAEAAAGRPDETRPLTAHGLRDAELAGVALKRLGIRLDACLSSPKRRAIETAQLACEPLGLEVTVEPALARSEFDLQQLVAGLGDTLVVGHDPTISTVVRDLTGARVHMRKGGLAGIDRDELVVLMTPAEIGAISQTTGTAT
jgi:phosphohistidine phosphatase